MNNRTTFYRKWWENLQLFRRVKWDYPFIEPEIACSFILMLRLLSMARLEILSCTFVILIQSRGEQTETSSQYAINQMTLLLRSF